MDMIKDNCTLCIVANSTFKLFYFIKFMLVYCYLLVILGYVWFCFVAFSK